MVRPDGLTAWVLTVAVDEPDSIGPVDVLSILLFVVIMGIVVGAAFRLMSLLVVRYGPVADRDTPPFGAAVAAGYGGVAATLWLRPGPENVLAFPLTAVGFTAVSWALAVGTRRLAPDGAADRAAAGVTRYSVPTGIVVFVVSFFVLSWGNVLFWLGLLLVAVFGVATFLSTAGRQLVSRYCPSPDRAVLPSHYGGLLQRSAPVSTRECPDCGATVHRETTVCPHCATTLTASESRDDGRPPNGHLLE